MIQGDVAVFLDALRADEGDPSVQRALAFIGGEPEVETYTDRGFEEKYLSLSDRGVDFLLMAGALDTVFVYAADADSNRAFGGWETLVEGVGPGSTPADVRAALGEPVFETSTYMRYQAGTGYVQFVFDGQQLTMLVVMAEAIGGDEPAGAAPVVEGVGGVDGDLATFMRAIGQPMFSPQHFDVIGITGPASDSRDEERDGVTWQYEDASRAGVLLQFRQEILVGALIRLRGDEGEPVYPAHDGLVAGLPLPASRAAIQERFGTPRRSSQHMDLYLVDDVYLRFDFEGDVSTSVAVVQPGVEV